MPGEGGKRGRDDVVLALNEAATNTILYRSGGGQPVQVVVHVSDDVVGA